MTEEGKQVLVTLEGMKFGVYLDAAGYPTIGVGHKLTKDELSSGKIWICLDLRSADLTESQALALMEADLPLIQSLVTVKLSPHQWDALSMFVFNIGIGAFRGSTLLARLNAGHPEQVPEQMRRWVYSGGKVIPGLINRREAEIKVWNHPALG